MPVKLVMHLNSWNLAIAPECAFSSVSNESDIEFIDAREHAFDFLAVRHRHGDCDRRRFRVKRSTALSPSAARPDGSAADPEILQSLRIRNSRCDALEISRSRVAAAALRVEVGLTGRRVAHDNIENNRWSCGRPALAASGSGDAMNELGNGRDV